MATKSITCSRIARTKGSAQLADFNNKNWGLIRHTSDTNPFTSLSYGGVGQDFTYTYDDNHGQGENVDIIFILTGMIYTDNAGYKTSGVSRINQFDWRSLTNSPTSVNVDYSTSARRSSHSEAVVACACHNDYGAATKSNIYIIPKYQIFNSSHYWVLPKLFHQQKGNSNPTMVVNSFGETGYVQFVKNITYRGDTYVTINGENFPSGAIGYPNGFFKNRKIRVPRPTDDVLLEEMTDAGVIHICSAGNASNKLDVPGGIDYNNYFLNWNSLVDGTGEYFNRPTFANEDSITVGNLDSWFNDGNTEVTDTGDLKEICQLSGEFAYETSNMGPVVDCYVAGKNVPIQVPDTSNHALTKNLLAEGTSYSCPTLAGLVSMVLSKYPTTTPAQMRKYVRDIAVSSATMGNPVVAPIVSDGDKGDVDYNKIRTSQNSNLKITYIDPSLSYDTSGITDTSITYPSEIYRSTSDSSGSTTSDSSGGTTSNSSGSTTNNSNRSNGMATRTYGDLFNLVSNMIGAVELAADEQTQLRHFINRRFQEAFDESPVWPRYLVSSEEREVFVLIASGATASTSTEVNGNYKILGQDANGFNVYTKGGTSADFIYKNVSGQWVVDVFASATKQTDGSYSVTGGAVRFTEADSPTTSSPFDVETWTPITGSDVLLLEQKQLIPYEQTNKNTIGDFNRIHRKKAFLNNSAIEYDFFVDFDGANILNIISTTDNTAFVTYKKQFTPFAVTTDYYNSTAEVPAEFFNFIAHSAYADFLRVQNKQEEAIAEEQVAKTYLALELEKIDIRSNNSTINKRFSTYVSRQSR